METQTLTWEEISRWEPMLRELEVLARNAMKAVSESKAEKWCANRFFYGYVKPFICLLVGSERGYPLAEASPDDELHFIRASEWPDDNHLRRPATNDRETFLRSSEAYDIVYGHLYELMPYCRDCMCM